MHAECSAVAVFVMWDIAVASVALYLLPVLIGWTRRVRDIGLVAAVNVLLGWTLIGWMVALALAVRSARQPNPAGQSDQRPPAPASAAAPSEVGRWADRSDLHPHREGCAPPLELPPRPADPGAGSWARAPAR